MKPSRTKFFGKSMGNSGRIQKFLKKTPRTDPVIITPTFELRLSISSKLQPVGKKVGSTRVL
eukprot:808847-Amorphochlora_amoeboformis.AAC.1